MKFCFGIICCLLQFTFTAHAQRICGTTDYSQKLMLTNPLLKAGYDNAEAQITASTQRNLSIEARDTNSNEIIYIPVVIHILYKSAAENLSTEQVQSQFISLN